MRIYSLLLLLFSITGKAQISVLYGDFPAENFNSAICIDKEGSLYPDLKFSNERLRQFDNSLLAFFKESGDEFNRVSAHYNCTFENFSEANFSILQDSIVKRKSKNIKLAAGNKSITFLIHGFRKPFRDTLYDWSSPRDFAEMKKALNSVETHFVEVYWDGQYGCCFSKDIKRNKELFKAFEKAQGNAILTGFCLRKVIAHLTADCRINIVTHSLGAKVALHAAFESTLVYQNLKIVMVAPAIGKEEFLNRAEKISKAAHCDILIVYNRKDFVLRKKDNHLMLLGPGPYKYGNTSIGCNHRRCGGKLEKSLSGKNIPVTISFYDLTSSVGKCHHVRCYFTERNMNESTIGFIK